MTVRPRVASLILLANAVALCVYAQTFAVEPSPIGGITMVGSGAPGFSEAVSRIVGANPSLGMQQFLRYAVVVTNTSSKSLLAFTVRYEIQSADGQTRQFSHQVSTGLKSPVLAPGAQYLVSIDQASYADLRAGRPLPPGYISPATGALSVSAHLDSCIYSDGTFSGPDQSKNYARDSEELQADLDFCTAIQSLRNDENAAWSFLQNEAAAQAPSANGLLTDTAYARRRINNAKMFAAVQRFSGFAVMLARCDEQMNILQQIHLHK